MGRRRKGKSIEMKILLPEDIYFQLESRLTNNFNKKPIYGLRSQLITALILKWLQQTTELKKEPENVE